ncbi:MAG: hypothetical protein KDI13_05595 [Alphaproteobacteria bacterium]|nr:hypothetical protein [Alphaproteobacteria bacterium]
MSAKGWLAGVLVSVTAVFAVTQCSFDENPKNLSAPEKFGEKFFGSLVSIFKGGANVLKEHAPDSEDIADGLEVVKRSVGTVADGVDKFAKRNGVDLAGGADSGLGASEKQLSDFCPNVTSTCTIEINGTSYRGLPVSQGMCFDVPLYPSLDTIELRKMLGMDPANPRTFAMGQSCSIDGHGVIVPEPAP